MPERNIRLIDEELKKKGKTSPKVSTAPADKVTAPAEKTQGSSSSAYQQLRTKAESDKQYKWYSGDQPTNSEVLASIYKVSKYNPKQGSDLYAQYRSLSSSPSSPSYQPYKTATNTAITQLQQLGYNVTGDNAKDWLQQNQHLQASYRSSDSTGKPLAPTKTSTPEQNAAYWYYKLWEAEDTTEQAELEWKSLQDEVTYWAKRTDRNYSDEEILGKINMDDYPTLKKMDEGASVGVPILLNRGVGYTQDALKGVIWNARNGASDDLETAAVRSVLGQGKAWKENQAVSDRLDPTSDSYNPYTVGSTIDRAALYFGVNSFDAEWLKQNRAALASGDDTAKKMYQSVYNAEQITLAAEQELADLKSKIAKRIKYASFQRDPEKALDNLLEDCPTLSKMDESLEDGDIIPTTRAIEYDKKELLASIRDDIESLNAKPSGADIANDIAESIGGSAQTTETDKPVVKQAEQDAKEAIELFDEYGTDTDRLVIQTTPSPTFDSDVKTIHDAIMNGIATPEQASQVTMRVANDYARQNFFTIMDGVLPYMEGAKKRDAQAEVVAKLDAEYPAFAEAYAQYKDSNPESYSLDRTEEVRQLMDDEAFLQFAGKNESVADRIMTSSSPMRTWEEYQKTGSMPEEIVIPEEQQADFMAYIAEADKLARLQNDMVYLEEKYNSVSDAYQLMQENYSVAGGYDKDFIGNLTLLYDYGSSYSADWSAYSMYDTAQMTLGTSVEDLYNSARNNRDAANNIIKQIDDVIAWADDNDVTLSREYRDNLEKNKAKLDRVVQDANYYLLREVDGFKEAADQVRVVMAGASNDPLLKVVANPEAYSDVTADNNSFAPVVQIALDMTDAERDTYLYLYGTQGKDSANAYWTYLTDPTYGMMSVRQAQKMQESISKDLSGAGFWKNAAYTAGSVLVSPAQAIGAFYAIGAAVTGNEINPYSSAFGASSYVGTVRGTVKQNITDTFGEGSVGAALGNFAYDVVTSGADSALNAAMMGSVTGSISKKLGKGLVSKAASSFVGAMPMGVSSASATIQDIKMRGGSDADALIMGGISALSETITEAVELDDILGAFSSKESMESLLKKTLGNMASEAFGESASEIISTAAEYLFLGENSGFEQSYRQYVDEYGDTDVAARMAMFESAGQALYAAALGATSGGMSQLSAAALSRTAEALYSNKRANASTNTIETMDMLFPGLDAYEQSVGLISDDGYVARAVAALSESMQSGSEATVIAAIMSSSGTPDNLIKSSVRGLSQKTDLKYIARFLRAALSRLNVEEVSVDKFLEAVKYAGNNPDSKTADLINLCSFFEFTEKEAGTDASLIVSAYENEVASESMQEQSSVTRQAVKDGNDSEQVQERQNAIGSVDEDSNSESSLEGERPAAYAQAAAYDQAVAEEKLRLSSSDTVAEVNNLKHQRDQLTQQRRQIQQKIRRAKAKAEAMGKQLTMLNQQLLDDPQNTSLIGSIQQTAKAIEAAQKVITESEDALQHNTTERERLANEIKAAAERANAELTAQAKANVDQRMQEEATAAVEQEAAAQQAEAEQAVVDEEANRKTVAADEFIDRYYGNSLTDEQRQTLREKYMAKADQNTPVSKDNDAFLRGVARKFNARIRLIDTHGLFKGARTQDGTIVVDRSLSQGEAVKQIVTHELTHTAERSNYYADLVSAVKDVVFKGDEARFKAASQKMLDLYQSQGVNIDEAGAEAEVVAQAVADALGREDMVNRLAGERPTLAQRILEFIKDAVAKLTGLKGSEYDQLRRMEKTLEKAIQDAQKKGSEVFPVQGHPNAAQFSVSQIAKDSGYTLKTDDEGYPVALIDKNGKEVTHLTVDDLEGSPFMKMIESVNEVYGAGEISAGSGVAKVLNGSNVTEEKLNQIKQMYVDLVNLCLQYKDHGLVWEIASTELFSPLKKNADKQYGTTVDFGTICTKTQSLINVMSKHMLEKKSGLTRRDVLVAYREVAKNDLAVPCPVCYVFSRWMGVPNLLNNMKRYQERFSDYSEQDLLDYVRSVEDKYARKNPKNTVAKNISNERTKLNNKLKNLSEKLAGFVQADKEAPKALRDKVEAAERDYADLEAYSWVTQVRLVKDKATGAYRLNESYRPVPDDVLFDLNAGSRFAQFPASWRYRTTRGAGMGKAILPYSGARIGDMVYNNQVRNQGSEGKALMQAMYDEDMDISENKLANGKKDKAAIQRAVRRYMAQNLIGGQRFQSTSDYRPEWGLDYMITFMQLQMLGAKGQLYTKVKEAVPMFASVGIETNLSIMPKGQGYSLDENGNPVLTESDFSNVTGMDFNTALKLTQMYDNVQMILVGINDKHIRAAMADPRIGFVIPWHASGNSGATLQSLMRAVNDELVESRDYSKVQEDKEIKNASASQLATRDVRKKILTGAYVNGVPAEDMAVIEGNKYLSGLYNRMYVDSTNEDSYHVFLSSSQAEKIFPHEYWDKLLTLDQADQNGDRFLEYCASLGMEPRFKSFSKDPGYWKLLIDRPMYNRDGTYHEPKPIDVTGFSTADIPTEIATRYNDQAKETQAAYDLARALEQTPNPPTTQFAVEGVEDVLNDEADQVNQQQNQQPVENNAVEEQLVDSQIAASTSPDARLRPRKFSHVTLQDTEWVPEEFKKSFIGPERNGDDMYVRQTNDEQIQRAWESIRERGGVEPTVEYLTSKPHDQWNTNDNVMGQIIASAAVDQGDMGTLFSVAVDYEHAGTDIGHALQSRTILKKLSPTALKIKLVGDGETRLQDILNARPRVKDEADQTAAQVQSQLEGADTTDIEDILSAEGTIEYTSSDVTNTSSGQSADQGTASSQGQSRKSPFDRYRKIGNQREEILDDRPGYRKRLGDAANQTADEITGSDVNSINYANRWNVPLNEAQRKLISIYGLQNTPRALNYNWASTKQRMLEYIISTADPFHGKLNGISTVQRLEYMKRGLPVVTPVDVDYIGARMQEYTTYSKDDQNTRQADLAMARAAEAYGNIQPASKREKLRTWRYVSMLLNVQSAERNIIGNVGQNLLNGAAGYVGVAIDKAVSKKTGVRTKANISLAEQREAFRAMRKETVNTFRDFYMDKAVTQRGTPRFEAGRNRGRVFENPVAEAMRHTEEFLMTVGDRPVWKRQFVASMAEQQRLAELNGVAFDANAATEQAERDANFSTFTESNSVADWLSSAGQHSQALSDFLSFFVPFTRVPLNISKRIAQYSPMGFAIGLGRYVANRVSGRNFDQLAFVNDMSRAFTGSALMAAGVLLGMAGHIKLGSGEEDKDKVYDMITARGDQYTPYVTAFGKNISLAAFAPSVSPLIMGAKLSELAGDDEEAKDVLAGAAIAAVDQVFDASFMSGLKDLFGGYGSITENLVTTGLSNAIGQNIPSLFKQMVTSFDPYVRDTKDKSVLQEILNKALIQYLPGLRQTLGVKVDITGEPVMNSKYSGNPALSLVNNLFNPFTMTDVKDDPVINELLRLYEATGQTDVLPSDRLRGRAETVNGVIGTIKGKDKQAYREMYGKTWHTAIEELISSDAYAAMDDAGKRLAIKPILEEADAKTKAWARETFGAEPDKVKQPDKYFLDHRSEYPSFDWALSQLEATNDERYAIQGVNETTVRKYGMDADQRAWYEDTYRETLAEYLDDAMYSGLEGDDLADAVKDAQTKARSKATNLFKKEYPSEEE